MGFYHSSDDTSQWQSNEIFVGKSKCLLWKGAHLLAYYSSRKALYSNTWHHNCVLNALVQQNKHIYASLMNEKGVVSTGVSQGGNR